MNGVVIALDNSRLLTDSCIQNEKPLTQKPAMYHSVRHIPVLIFSNHKKQDTCLTPNFNMILKAQQRCATTDFHNKNLIYMTTSQSISELDAAKRH